MPWSISNPPRGTEKLPIGALRIFIAVANKVLKETNDEEAAMIAGWQAVKRYYEKTENGWKLKAEEASSDVVEALIILEFPYSPTEAISNSLDVILKDCSDGEDEIAGGVVEEVFEEDGEDGEDGEEQSVSDVVNADVLTYKQKQRRPGAQDAIFPSDHPKVKDGKNHFPIPDLAHARNALARVAQYDAPPDWWDGTLEELQQEVRTAVYKKFPSLKKKDINSDIYTNLPDLVDVEPHDLKDALREVIASADIESIDVVMDVIPKFSPIVASEDIESLVCEALERQEHLIQNGREPLCASYVPDTFNYEDDGEVLHFEAVVGQVDTPLVPRLFPDDSIPMVFPKEEIEKNLPRLRKEIEMGRLFGEADHPPDGRPRIRETCVAWDDIRIEGTNIVAKGRTTKNAAGRDIRALALTPINLEFSLRGYGRSIKKKWEGDGPFKGKDCIFASDFILRTFDVVTTGLAKTGITNVVTDATGGINMSDKELVQASAEEHTVSEQSDEVKAVEASAPAPQQEVESAPDTAPGIDPDAVKSMIQESIKASLDEFAARHAVANEVERVKARVHDEGLRTLIEAHLKNATSVDEVRQIEQSLESVFEKLSDPVAGIMAGQGVVAGTPKDKPLSEYMADGEGNIVRRPDTVQEVRAVLMAGIPDNGKPTPDNPRVQWERLLDNYMAGGEASRFWPYLYSLTRRGYKEFIASAQTTSALGTQTPQVLPLLRVLYPKLFAHAIASVQPIAAPTARVYWMKFKRLDEDTYTHSREDFDYDWADRAAETTEKVQLGIELEAANVSAEEKSIYYNVSQELLQDMANVHGVNAQQELLNEAAAEIAREVNYEMLADMMNNCTGASLTYGTQLPSSGWTNLSEWWKMLIVYINKAAAQIRRDNSMGPNFLVCDPMAAALLSALPEYTVDGNVIEDQFGIGLKRLGTVSSQYIVYQADWLTPNRILLGYKGDSWTRAGYVYAPYIPLYISPVDYTAATNTAAQSVTSRYATYFARPELFGKIIIAAQAGTNPF